LFGYFLFLLTLYILVWFLSRLCLLARYRYCFSSGGNVFNNANYLQLALFVHYYITWARHTWSIHWSWRVHVSQCMYMILISFSWYADWNRCNYRSMSHLPPANHVNYFRILSNQIIMYMSKTWTCTLHHQCVDQ
jgi:hypothetical protein